MAASQAASRELRLAPERTRLHFFTGPDFLHNTRQVKTKESNSKCGLLPKWHVLWRKNVCETRVAFQVKMDRSLKHLGSKSKRQCRNTARIKFTREIIYQSGLKSNIRFQSKKEESCAFSSTPHLSLKEELSNPAELSTNLLLYDFLEEDLTPQQCKIFNLEGTSTLSRASAVCHKWDVLHGFHGDFFTPAAPRATGLKIWITTHVSFFQRRLI